MSDVASGAGASSVQRVDAYAASAPRQWWLVCVLVVMGLLAIIDKTVLSLLFDSIREDLRLSDTQMSVIYGLSFALANVAFTLPAGWLADRWSRRGLLACGAVVWSLMTGVFGLGRSFTQLFAARAAVGFSEAVLYPSCLSLLRAALSPERRGRGFAVFSASPMGGSALGYILGSALLQWATWLGPQTLPLVGELQPWRVAMLLLAVLGLPLVLLLATVREPVRNAAQAGQGTVGEATRHLRAHWRVYVPLFAYFALYSMQSGAYGAFLVPVATRVFHLDVQAVGRNFGMLQLAAAPLGLLVAGLSMDRLVRRWGRRGPALVGAACVLGTCIMSTLTPLAPTPAAFYLSCCGLFFFAGVAFAVMSTVIAMVTPARNMGKVSAVQLFFYGVVGLGVGPMIVGYASDHLFTGAQAVARALALCCGAFTLASFLSIAALCATIGTRPPLDE